MPGAFISYVRENQSMVDRLVTDLKGSGARVWMDRNDIKPGQRWADAIRQAIVDGDFFIACFSKEYSNKSRSFMNEELTVAVEELRQRPQDTTWFLPLKLNECEIPARTIGAGETIRDFQWVDMTADWDNGLNRLLSVIRPDDDKIEISSRMLSIFMHELAVPMTMISAIADRLETKVDDRELQMYANGLAMASHLSRNQLQQFRSTITLTSESPKLYKSQIDVHRELQRVMRPYSHRASNEAVRIQIRGREMMPRHVFADANMFSLLLDIFCDNAVKYSMRRDKAISVIQVDGSRSTRSELVLEFANDGMPIAETDVDRIFERSVRGGNAMQVSVSGQGNGLFLARRITELHGGTIRLLRLRDPVVFELRMPVSGNNDS